MLDRRQDYRRKVYYGARIAFNDRQSTLDCLVRDFSPLGARLEFVNQMILPAQFDLSVHCKGVAFLAHVTWRRGQHCGIEFRDLHATRKLPLDIVLRDRAHQRAARAMRHEIANLRGFA